MNLQRLNELYSSPVTADRNDVENLKQLTIDYPYFQKPFVILARHYFDTNHYKFEDMLRQAAMRVKDRRALYEYIHGKTSQEFIQSKTSDLMVADTLIELPEQETQNGYKKPNLDDFLTGAEPTTSELIPDQEFSLELADNETAFEFEFEGHFKLQNEAEVSEQQDIIGEEINTEFSFSKSFLPKELELEPILENRNPVIDDINADIHSDNTQKELPDEEFAEEEIIQEPRKQSEHNTDLNLRKYPVYNLEEFINGNKEPVEISEGGSESGSKDFFSWLKHPQNDETEDGLEIEQIASEEGEPHTSPRSLDIIEKFIAVNPQISRPKKEFYNPENMAKRSELLDLEFVSETLANIYYEQGNLDLALKAYEKLSLQNPSKQAYFANLIEKIKKERK